MSDNYEVMLAFAIEEVQIELVGDFTGDEVKRINLTEYATEQLREHPIGSAESAIASLFEALGLTTEQLASFDLRGLIQGIPGVGDLIDRVLEAQLYLTDLSYEPGDKMEIGILIDFDLKVGPVQVSKVGLKVTHDLSSQEK